MPSRFWKYKYLVLIIWMLYGCRLKLENFCTACPEAKVTEKIAVDVKSTTCSFVNFGSTIVLKFLT